MIKCIILKCYYITTVYSNVVLLVVCSDLYATVHDVSLCADVCHSVYIHTAVRRSTRPSLMREVDLTALNEAFNIPLGLDSDSDESDQEYAPHREGKITS